ncbi:isopenicillin N synthase family dioxygenase [Acetobacter fallax]|uniref:2-oxoglutarate-dependent ethylene/succinate-forming enzyme n=1 Tax=Acetobacter fallax TaxID=1737473 RepID=A0ABX0KAQ5_9PROT|nr:isopenicillin N synthase family oxygenase [Acetobacter fallax]NHO31590.1 isopenicillin N synthase family oxygenase [Acetobacter fallax]NHO35149.1 isopenicillin N synthase family oxygenase [Acetobacter fallax]
MHPEARQVSPDSLPVIPVAGLCSSDPVQRQAVGDALRTACASTGFFYCVDHGIPPALIDAVLAESKAFFARSPTDKAALDKARSPCNRGYEPLRNQTLEAGTPPDLKEGFYIGEEQPANAAELRFNQGPNQWPRNSAGFRPTMMAYFAALNILAERLMRGIALSLGLEETFFTRFCQNPQATLRLLHYPPQPSDPQPGEKGCGAHTDFGGLTLLLQDASGGLQVRGPDDTWIHATPILGSFIVNLGDMIARWTNDRYRSTLHRVVNTSGTDRYSVPFFHSGNPDYVISCLPGCLAPGETPRYPSVTVQDHLREMYQRTYGQ